MTYLTFIGNHDKIVPGQPFGAAITIFLQYKEQLERVYIFVTPSKPGNGANYNEIAQKTKSVMDYEKPGIQVELIPLDLQNPIDYDLVYPVMLHETQKIFEDEGIKKADKIINITSGTPTMTGCWVLLHKSGLIPNSKIVQSFETKFARKRGKSTQEVNLEIDDFPKIVAPLALKQQLTILSRQKNELAEKVKQTELDERVPELIGQSKAIREIKEQLLYDLDKTTNVLITGERGSGKQIIANAIWRMYHNDGDERLTTFDCGTFSKDLISSELFGYKKGAFTGATADNNGILKSCDGKMLFLDEIGNLPISGQQTLLRYLQTGEIRKVGSQDVDTVRTQIIAAANKNINDSTLFAQDLKDRFDDVICLPNLKERKEDIPELINFFLSRYSTKPMLLGKKLLNSLVQYDWPGNVRELEKWIQKLVRRFSEGGTISINDIPDRLITSIMKDADDGFILPDMPMNMPLNEYIEQIRDKARKQAGGNMAEVDRMLGQKPGTEKQRQHRAKKE